ncbi:hypothetical protein MKX03_015423 [Papaver bracteatum]|nr:hypothetical protein MKX03_015423 [Papaver bracteatum]
MHFFEVLQSSIIRDKQLELRKEFTVKFGKELSNHAIIKVPNAGIWHIGLRKAEGVIFFENGWPEFMEFYSICVGYVILFRYDGNSEFQVYIFGKDATEIDYPTHIDNTTHSGSTQSNYEPSMSNESSLNQTAEPGKSLIVKFIFTCVKSRKQKWVIPTRFHTKGFRAALEAAEAFKSENPFFKVILRAYNIIRVVKVPIVFANSYLRGKTRMVITLRISDGKTWEVGCISRLAESTLSKGWYKFVADNHLKEGDVCVFELVDRKKIEMIVHIFGQQKTFAKKLTPKSHTAEFQAKLEAAEEFTSENPFFKIMIVHIFRQQNPFARNYYTEEFQTTLEAAEEFISENPFFKVVLLDEHIKAGMVKVPAVFATSHLTNITRMVITLKVSDEKTWEVGYVSQRYVSRRPTAYKIAEGWREFVADNDLKEGDVCVFELVDLCKNFKMNVHIFRLEQDGID